MVGEMKIVEIRLCDAGAVGKHFRIWPWPGL